ncbi:MAG: hypothetical protein JST50_23125 [Bacteroidetes bacterium]|jgi:glycogen synthase|nr:hypothetical protein [Bacteroidota bacterium]
MEVLTISVSIKDDWVTYLQLIFSFISLIITFFGVLYVVKTFNSQKEINEEQRQINLDQKVLNNLAMEKDRREIRPYFKLRAINGMLFNPHYIDLYLDNAIAFEVLIEYTSGGRYNVQPNVLVQSEWHVGFEMRVIFTENSEENNQTDGVGILNVKFKDESNRAYSQSVHINNVAYISIPRLVENYSMWQV